MRGARRSGSVPIWRRAVLAALFLLNPEILAAEDIHLLLPIRCVPGKTCWVANYVDLDAGTEARDFACGARTYDGHKGTDFAIRDLGQMRRGIDVLAAAGGVVKAARDGMEDVDFSRANPKSLNGRECGNGVVIEHGNGWTTQYCHMQKDTVSVKTGQRISAGAFLGRVGLSGKTIFPHLHFQVTLGKSIVDPFAGRAFIGPCGGKTAPLWTKEVQGQLPYRPFEIYNAGMSVGAPDLRAIRDGRAGGETLPAGHKELYLWAEIFGVEAGDEITYSLRDTEGGSLIERRLRQEERKSRLFLYVGKRLPDGAGRRSGYVGTIRLSRDTPNGIIVDTMSVESRRH